KLYKDAYRDLLRSLGLTVNQEDAFFEEAGVGFGYNKAIFEELADYADSLTPMAVCGSVPLYQKYAMVHLVDHTLAPMNAQIDDQLRPSRFVRCRLQPGLKIMPSIRVFARVEHQLSAVGRCIASSCQN